VSQFDTSMTAIRYHPTF